VSDRRVAKKKQKRFNGQTWPKDLKISSLNRFCRDKKIVTNSFLEIIVRYVLENSLKSSKKKMWL